MQGSQPQVPCVTLPIEGAIRKALGLPVLLPRAPGVPQKAALPIPGSPCPGEGTLLLDE